MAEHHQTGAAGEEAAARYLTEQGFLVLHRNYRYQRAEVDLIAQKDRLLLFVEVKTRRNHRHGLPEAAVNQKKIDLFLLAADAYIYQHNWQHDIRFDIIAVSGLQAPFEIYHIEDAFH